MVGDKYVSSPSNKLTDNYFFAGVFTDENIDKVFGYWDKDCLIAYQLNDSELN